MKYDIALAAAILAIAFGANLLLANHHEARFTEVSHCTTSTAPPFCYREHAK